MSIMQKLFGKMVKMFFTIVLTAWKVSIFGVFLVRIFPHSVWMRRVTPYLSVFSPNPGKYGPEKLRIRTLFTQCFFNKDSHFTRHSGRGTFSFCHTHLFHNNDTSNEWLLCWGHLYTYLTVALELGTACVWIQCLSYWAKWPALFFSVMLREALTNLAT